ncbi:hypothetical protein [Kitasatospora purpeofusca]|uniref:hypothetical protein n=1 Tax=Kitasatospora purpeofusca TaxID=67352 RepID=UPI002A5A809A|nr:hypothetical protein [Kitasatospora purpeofusca]MDY0813538.1 hypothetical protein [Kitasatospora purpeofusca]
MALPGKAVARTSVRASDGKVVWAQNEELSTQGRVTKDSSTNGLKAYGYDRLGRLTKAEQATAATGCTTRTCTYDVHCNRTAKSTSGQAGDGSCATAGATTTASAYDSADRITDAGYRYDVFGRTVGTPSGRVLGYRVNDLVASQETATTRQTWTLDPVGRLNGSTTATKRTDGSWATTATKLNHYGGGSDSPRWTAEDTTGAWIRNVPGTDGDFAATATDKGAVKLQLANLFGSVVLVIDTAHGGRLSRWRERGDAPSFLRARTEVIRAGERVPNPMSAWSLSSVTPWMGTMGQAMPGVVHALGHGRKDLNW